MASTVAANMPVGGSSHGRRLRFGDRLHAEAGSVWEQLEEPAIDDRAANTSARGVEGDFEQRLIARSRALPIAASIESALRHVRSVVGLIVFGAIVFALLAGVATARAALGVPRDEPVNIFHVLAAALLPQTLFLIAWLVVMLMPRSGSPLLSIASLGGVVLRLGQWLARRVHPGRAYQAAVAGTSRTFLTGSLGRWTLSSISHALWLAFNVGCLGMLFFLLSTRQYVFAWETTILSERAYTPLTRAIAALPKAAGFEVPSDQQIQASQWTGNGPLNTSASQAWSALLVGSLMVYGFAPRLLLLGLSLGQRRAATHRYRLDVQRPEFARLRAVLEPPATSLGVVDPAPADIARIPTPVVHAVPNRPAGLPAIVGFELPRVDGEASWPPRLHDVRWHDLGMVDGRDDQRRVLGELSRGREEPAAVVVVCSLTTTPDRGVAAFLSDVSAAISRSPLLVLTGGQHLRDRADPSRIEMRLSDWRQMAERAGMPRERVVEVDLDHLTHASQARLNAMIVGDDAPRHERRFEQAIALITSFARDGKTDARNRAALHNSIARAYSNDSSGKWRDLLRVPTFSAATVSAESLGANLASSARRFTQLLPERLQRSPKWLAAGAAAGAFGCIAAAAMISPVAISALPIWSGLGAAIAAVAQPSPRSANDAQFQHDAASGELDAAVRSAALFAMLLELQGFDERLITRVLDRVVVDADSSTDGIASAEDAQRWLNDLRHRFDAALAQETRA